MVKSEQLFFLSSSHWWQDLCVRRSVQPNRYARSRERILLQQSGVFRPQDWQLDQAGSAARPIRSGQRWNARRPTISLGTQPQRQPRYLWRIQFQVCWMNFLKMTWAIVNYDFCFNSRTDQHKNDLWEFKVDSNTWVRLNPSGKGPSPRRRQAFCLVVSRALLFTI